MDVVVVLVIVAVIVALGCAYIYLVGRRTASAVVTEQAMPLPVPRGPAMKLRPPDDPAVFAQPAADPVVPSSATPPHTSPPLFDLDLDLEPAAAPVDIRWWRQFDVRSEALDDTARMRLIGDLGVVAMEWCVPLLAGAYTEERGAHRQAALTALAACRSRSATATFRAALAADDPAGRAIARDALADLEPAPEPKKRRTVERHS